MQPTTPIPAVTTTPNTTVVVDPTITTSGLTTNVLTPEQMTTATNALAAAIQSSGQIQGRNIEAQAAQLAPGLSTGSNAPGGYNYNRTIAPVLDPLANNFVIQAKQGLVRQSLKDAQYVAKTNYEDANYAYQQRQRDYVKEQSRRAARAAAAAYSGGGGGSMVAGSNVNDVTTTNNANGAKQYVGNNDIRGRLAFLAKNGDNDAKIALQYVGNDGKFGSAPAWTQAAMNKFGFTGNYAKAAAPAPVIKQQPNKLVQQMNDAFLLKR